MPVDRPTPDEILSQIGFHNYISRSEELSSLEEACRVLLVAQAEDAAAWTSQVARALNFSRTLWKKYDCEDVADVYQKFQRIEESLFGLERDEVAGRRYRDHFVHMFNCYVFGLRLITAMLGQLDDDASRSVFKVQDETLTELGLPFGNNYSYKKRLFYLWTLVATFHDLAIPFQHLRNIGSGINVFVEEFGWKFSDPHVGIRSYDASQLHHYFDLLGRVYGGKLVCEEEGRRYHRTTRPNHYLSKILGREFDHNDHGVLSGYFLWRTIEEIFLVSRTTKYKLDIQEFNIYAEYVLEQDVARAALAISLHNLGADSRTGFVPHVFPISFSEFPLTFLLILADELQEYLRWEGSTVEGQMRFGCHPNISVTTNQDGEHFCTDVQVTYSWEQSRQAEVLAQARAIAQHRGISTEVTDLSRAADIIGNGMKSTLESRLLIGENFRLSVEILADWRQRLFNKDFRSVALDADNTEGDD